MTCLAEMQRNIEQYDCFAMYPQILPLAYDWILYDDSNYVQPALSTSQTHAVISFAWLNHLYVDIHQSLHATCSLACIIKLTLFNISQVPQIRPLADIVHFKYAHTYLLTYLRTLNTCRSRHRLPVLSVLLSVYAILRCATQITHAKTFSYIFNVVFFRKCFFT